MQHVVHPTGTPTSEAMVTVMGVLTVSRVAASLGYRSEAAFTRAFTQVDGTTPGAVGRGRSAS
ncbi:hypothetical protein [Egicoccus sp. AB-alg2]|uniref:hypothetical protein n=1 Tax=Egicoccus sp. AB-alg2 TaxID=3242693 RepID=UPI00359CDA92